MQIGAWVLALCLVTAVTARPEGRPSTAEDARVVEGGVPNAIKDDQAVEHAKAEAPASKPLLVDETKEQATKPLEGAKQDGVKEEPLKETQGEEDAMKLPVPIEPDFGSPDDPKVFPEGALRTPTAAVEAAVEAAVDASRIVDEKPEVALIPAAVPEPATPVHAEKQDTVDENLASRAARAYLPAEARGGDSDGLERRRGARQLTDIHHLFLAHPDHAARLSARVSDPKRHHPAGEGRSGADGLPAAAAARTARRARIGWTSPEAASNDLEQEKHYETSVEFSDDGQPTRFSLMREEGAVEDVDAATRSGNGYDAQPARGPAPRVTVTTFIPTLTAISTTTTTSADGEAQRPASSRITWPLASFFPVVIQDPLLGLYNSWVTGGGLASVPGNIFEYGPAADICSGVRAKRIRRDEAADAEAAVEDHAKEEAQEHEAEDDDEASGSGDGALSKVEPVLVDAEGSGEDAVTVENGENSLPTESYQEEDDDDDDSDRSPQDVLEKKLRKNKNKVDKRVHKVVAQVQGLAKRVEARVAGVLASSGVLGAGDAARNDAVPTLTRVVVRRGGVAVAGPGGIATAAFGGTAIVGPGGIAYTAPDSTAVAGPGARVVAVSSERLLDMFRAFREASERGVAAYRPAWLGSIPEDGKLVAVGPVVYRNPPEGGEERYRPAHWVFGNTRLLGLLR